MKKKVLVTGGSGFIAKNIIEQLADKSILIAPAHKELDLVNEHKVEDYFKKHGPFDVVIHTANVGGTRKKVDTWETAIGNLRIFFNVARCDKWYKRMIHLGSGAEYGKDKPIKKVREEDFDKRVPSDPYGYYKYLCAKYIERSDKIINLRLFGVYGKYEDFTIRFISNATCKSILRLPITINQNVYFDYLYVDDLVRIIDYFATHKTKYHSYNIGTGRPIDLVSIAGKIDKIAPYKSKVVVKLRGLANEYSCNNRRLMTELGDFKFTDFETSLKQLYAWHEESKSKLKRSFFFNDYF